MGWLDELLTVKARITAALDKLVALKGQVWDLVTRHPELKADAEAAFTSLRSAVTGWSPSAVFDLVAKVERIVTDSTAAYANEADALKAILDQLKTLAN